MILIYTLNNSYMVDQKLVYIYAFYNQAKIYSCIMFYINKPNFAYIYFKKPYIVKQYHIYEYFKAVL